MTKRDKKIAAELGEKGTFKVEPKEDGSGLLSALKVAIYDTREVRIKGDNKSWLIFSKPTTFMPQSTIMP